MSQIKIMYIGKKVINLYKIVSHSSYDDTVTLQTNQEFSDQSSIYF